MKKVLQKLTVPVDALSTEIFVRFFGLMIILQVWSYNKAGFIEKGILSSKVLFTYDLFHWVHPFPAGIMTAIPVILIFCGVLIMINKFRKIAIGTFCILFSYLFLLEKSYYNNHFYLMILLSFLFLFYTPNKNKGEKKTWIPNWFLLLLQFQVVIVYFYGGLAKISYDWMVRMQPIGQFLQNSERSSALPSLNSSSLALYILTYGGFLFDITIGFFLLNKRTRNKAIVLCVCFHMLNFLLFNFGSGGDIGIFPFLMMGTCILFADPETVRRKLSSLIPSLKETAKKKQIAPVVNALNPKSNKKLVMIFFFSYIGIQILFPLRHLMYSGNTSWTFRGGRFAWRMKVHTKSSKIKFYYQLDQNDTLRFANINSLINTTQESEMGEDPSTLLQLADYLGNDLKKNGYNNAVIKVSDKVSLNNRPFQFIMDSTANLLTLTHNLIESDKWILPLKDEE